ncbi:MAG: substrate-binding domain-containing protein [Bacteroidetes bacterium]|nr:substrate-binding domain-containing protein [Bacteroidota bacterium]
MVRKILLLVLVGICLIMPLSVFAAGEADDGIIRIGAPMADSSDKWLSYLEDGVRAFDAEYDDVEVMITDGKADPAVQLSSLETLLTKGVDAIAIVPVDISAIGPIIAKCEEAGVYLVVINRYPDEKFHDGIDAYVGSESIQAGLMQGKWVAAALGEAGGKVAIMTGISGHEAALMRTEGNKQVFADYPNIEIVAEAEGRWDRAKGMQIAENWFQAIPDLAAIVSNNDEMAIGSLLAAQSLGMADEDIIIAGVDATPDALVFLGKGLDVTVFQSAHGQGYGGVETAYRLIKGEKLDKMQWIPYELVTTENMADYQ